MHLLVHDGLVLFQIIDPFVEVEVIGLPMDCCKEQTRVVDDNGTASTSSFLPFFVSGRRPFLQPHTAHKSRVSPGFTHRLVARRVIGAEPPRGIVSGGTVSFRPLPKEGREVVNVEGGW